MAYPEYLIFCSNCAAFESAGIDRLAAVSNNVKTNGGGLRVIYCDAIDTHSVTKLTWPSAGRARALLEGAKVQLDNAAPVIPGGEKRKRPVDDAFEQDKTLDVSREAFGSADQEHPWTPDSAPCMQDMSNRMLAHMLGIDISGIEPPTSYYPGYQWWPRFPQGGSPLYEQTPPVDLMIPRLCNDYEPGVFDTHVGQQDCPSSGDPRVGMTSDIMSPNYFFDFSGMPTSGPS